MLAEKLEELDARRPAPVRGDALCARDEKALELLAGVYANPNWIGADGVERAAAIYFQIARRRQEAGDTEDAIAALRRALAAVPGHPESSELLERIYYDARRFQDLDRYYRERVHGGVNRERNVNFLYKRAQLAEGELGDVAEAQRDLQRDRAARAAGRPGVGAAGRSCTRRARVRQAGRAAGEAAGPGRGPEHRARDHAASSRRSTASGWATRDQAAVYLHAMLQLEPENQIALAAYAEHFREKGDWAALVDLLEFSCSARASPAASPRS